MTINSFISQVKSRGLARTNRYSVEIPFPTSNPDQNRLASLFCDAAQLPGVNVATNQQRITGEQRDFPYERMYDPLNLSFYVDTDMQVKLLFDNWINKVLDPNTKILGFYKDYVRDIKIRVLDVSEMKPKYTINLYEVYPKAVSPIQMDAAAKDVMKVNVTLQYKYFTIEEAQTSTTTSSVGGSSYASGMAGQDPQSITTGTGYTPTLTQMFKDVTSR